MASTVSNEARALQGLQFEVLADHGIAQAARAAVQLADSSRANSFSDDRRSARTSTEHLSILRTATSHTLVRGHINELLADFDYASRCILILQVAVAVRQLPKHNLLDSLRRAIACWDATLLLVDADHHDRLMHALGSSVLAPRLAFAHTGPIADQCTTLWAWQLNRLLTSSSLLPAPHRFPLDARELALLNRLPEPWHPMFRMALLRPDEWNCDLLAQHCGTSRRSLEREFERLGLRPPGKVLAAARKSRRTGVANQACVECAPPAI